jgi:hypothetical protein
MQFVSSFEAAKIPSNSVPVTKTSPASTSYASGFQQASNRVPDEPRYGPGKRPDAGHPQDHMLDAPDSRQPDALAQGWTGDNYRLVDTHDPAHAASPEVNGAPSDPRVKPRGKLDRSRTSMLSGQITHSDGQQGPPPSSSFARPKSELGGGQSFEARRSHDPRG